MISIKNGESVNSTLSPEEVKLIRQSVMAAVIETSNMVTDATQHNLHITHPVIAAMRESLSIARALNAKLNAFLRTES